MADNTLQNGADSISTDELVTLNGGASSVVKVQRVKPGFGVDGDFRDVSTSFPLPAVTPDIGTSGTLGATDATVNLTLTGQSTFSVEVGGSFVGTVLFERRVDATTWRPMTIGQFVTGLLVQSVTVPAGGSGYAGPSQELRCRMNPYTSGSATVTLRAGAGMGAIYMVGPLPTGANVVGKVGIDQTTPGTTNAVSVTNASLPVTNAGIFAVQSAATLSAETTKVIGTVNVSAGQSISATQATAANLQATATQGTAAAVAGAWTVKVTDGTNTAAVKAASTAAVATDPSQVVSLSPNNPIPTGTNSIGNIGTVTTVTGVTTVATVTTVGTVNTVAAMTPTASTVTAATLSSAATTNATAVKASAGNLYSVTASNVGAAAAFLKIFNLAVAPTVGTSVPFLTIPIAPSGVANITFGTQGIRMSAGISFSITNLVADADTTAIAAGQIKVAIAYI